jgi:hypothetical protein
MKKYHPDRYRGEDAEERAKAITAAYSLVRGKRAGLVPTSPDEPPDPFHTDPIDPALLREPFPAARRALLAFGLSTALLAAMVGAIRWAS